MATPIVSDPKPSDSARQRLQWAALVVQTEVLILFLSPALALLIRPVTQDPRPALVCLMVGPILWRLGQGVAQGSKGAILIVSLLYAFRVMATIASLDGSNLIDNIMMLIEGAAIGLAVYTIVKHDIEPDPRWRSELQVATAVPVLLGFGWVWLVLPAYARRVRSFQYELLRAPLVLLAMLLIGTAIVLAWRTAFIPRLYAAFRPDAPPLRLPERWRTDLAGATRPPLLDFILGIIIGGISFIVLAWFVKLTNQPSLMLSPPVILVPIFALAGIGAGGLWIAAGWAHTWQRSSERALRMAAIVGTVVVGMVAFPFLFGMARAFLEDWLHVR